MTETAIAPATRATVPQTRTWGLLAGAGVVFIWSGWIVVSRYGVQGTLTAYDITALRFGFATLATSLLWYRFKWREVRWGRALVAALGCGFPYTLLVFHGLRTSGAAQVGVLVNGSLPVLGVLLAAVLLKKRVLASEWLTCFLVFLANICMLGPSGWRLLLRLDTSSWGLLELLLAALSLAIYMTAVSAWRMAPREVLVLVPLINAALFVPVWALLLPSNLATAGLPQVAIQIFYQGFVVSVVALVLFTQCIRSLGAVNSGLFMAFVPMMTGLLAWTLLGEKPAAWQIAGIAICTLALLHHAITRREVARLR